MVDLIVDTSAPRGRVDIRTGVGRRRRWSEEEKGRIVAASLAPGAVVSEGTVIPPDSLVLGVPGKVVKVLTPELRERLAGGHTSYVAMQERHRAGEFPRHR